MCLTQLSKHIVKPINDEHCRWGTKEVAGEKGHAMELKPPAKSGGDSLAEDHRKVIIICYEPFTCHLACSSGDLK